MTVGKSSDFYGYLERNPNMTFYSVVWCVSEWDVNENVSVPCHYEHVNKRMMMYAIYYNYSLAPSYFLSSMQSPCPVDQYLLSLKVGVDNAILKYLGEEKGM